MNFSRLLVLVVFVPVCQATDPLTIGLVGGVVSGLFTAFNKYKCWLGTGFCRCDDLDTTEAKSKAIRDLHKRLDDHLFGQHLVKRAVVRALKGHINNKDPTKALVLSFHGWTGGGKNYVSRMIAESLFEKGLKSPFVHLFVSTQHFPHKRQVHTYKNQLEDWIHGNVSSCHRSIFIFDEIDKMPEGLIDALKPFIDTYDELNGIDFRKSIFLLLSNTAGTSITSKMWEFWDNGQSRETIQQKEMEEVITSAAYNEEGGLWHSSLIEKNLISHFVPFLPLERKHIKECIRHDLRTKGHEVVEKTVDKIANEMTYFPRHIKLFSKSGCKRVSEKVDLIIEEEG